MTESWSSQRLQRGWVWPSGPVAAAPPNWFYVPPLLALHWSSWLQWPRNAASVKCWQRFAPCTSGWQRKSCHQLFFSCQKSEALILEMKPAEVARGRSRCPRPPAGRVTDYCTWLCVRQTCEPYANRRISVSPSSNYEHWSFIGKLDFNQ